MPIAREIRPSHALRRFGLLAALSMLLLAGGVPPDRAVAGGPTCFGKKATIVSSARTIVGTKGHDVIVVRGRGKHTVNGLGGNDRICGGPGDDTIFGGRGNDLIHGGGGNDRIDGGRGSDRLYGGPGNDRLFGDRGNDRLHGGPGNDYLDGGPGDDFLNGDAGDDRLIGGAGNDRLLGGAGNDILRGDGGNDLLDGGPGHNIASYASAPRGVTVDLSISGRQLTLDGTDTLRRIDDLVGSPNDDVLRGNGADNRIDGGPGFDQLFAGGGNSTAYGGPGGAACAGFVAEHGCDRPATPPAGTTVLLSRGLDGDSLVVGGDRHDNQIAITRAAGAYRVTDSGPSGVYAGDLSSSGCIAAGPATAVCPSSAKLNFILATGGDGNDRIEVGAGVPAFVGARLNGGNGSDTLIGGPGHDTIESGHEYRRRAEGGPTFGNNTLIGGPGNDTLVADPGADNLIGGTGNDLLVSTATLCQGHRFSGGKGSNTVSYARVNGRHSGYSGTMRMKLGGTGGPAGGCKNGRPDRILNDNTNLEGSMLDDVMIGNNRGNTLFGGHGGRNWFLARGGRNFIDARNGNRDRVISCGSGRGNVMLDRMDPKPRSC